MRVEESDATANNRLLGQLLGYMGCLSASESDVRGVLVAAGFESRVVFAARGLSNVKLVKYQLSFNLQEIT